LEKCVTPSGARAIAVLVGYASDRNVFVRKASSEVHASTSGALTIVLVMAIAFRVLANAWVQLRAQVVLLCPRIPKWLL
jgi:hypothetical protein